MFNIVNNRSALVFALLFIFSSVFYLATDFAFASSDKVKVVTTTTMLADLASVIGGEAVLVTGLMGPGIDPHLYQASAGDVILLLNADVVIYNGLHLEGKLADVFRNLDRQGKFVISVEEGLDQSLLLAADKDSGLGAYDPHVWFDVSLWKRAAQTVATGLAELDPAHSFLYETNLNEYLVQLDELDEYIRRRVSEVPEEQRVLVTAHDAFSYFGNAYGFEVRGLQGLSTESEAGTADVSNLATFIVERQIRAIFIESSVSPRSIQALQAAVRAKGFEIAIGGELYSDSLGGRGSGAETYILTVKANVDTIVDALK